MKALYQLYTYYLSMSVCVAFSISIFLTLSFLWVLIFLFMYCNIVIFLLIIALGPAVKSGLHFLHSCVSERWPYQVLTAELANAVWILIFVLLIMHKCHGDHTIISDRSGFAETQMKLGKLVV